MNRVFEFVRAEKIYLLFFFFGILVVFYLTRNYVDSADLIQYLAISRAYSELGAYAAVNDFWSPMLSWLIIPVTLFTNDELFSFKLLQSIFAFLAFVFLIRWSNLLSFSVLIKPFFLFTCGLFFLGCAFFNGSPDLLYLLVLFVLFFIFEQSTKKGKMLIVPISFVGALLYFTKGFGFVFFVVLVLLFFILFRRKVNFTFVQLSGILVLFFALTLPWAAVISTKFGHAEISGASRYNFNLMHPENNPNVTGEIKHPIDKPHYLPPGKTYLVSAWENPNSFCLKEWTPSNDPIRYMKIVFRNLISLGYYYYPILFLILVVLGMFFVKGKQNELMRVKISLVKSSIKNFFQINFIIALVSFITTFLYSFILNQQRYLWVNNILLFLFFFFILNQINSKNKAVFFAVLFSFFVAYPFSKEVYSIVKSPLNIDWKSNALSNYLKNEAFEKNMVSDINLGADGYTVTCALGFFSGAKNSGIAKMDKLSSLKNLSFYLTKGNKTINSTEIPLLVFCAYEPQLNISLYRTREE